jgi:hypothetical protein
MVELRAESALRWCRFGNGHRSARSGLGGRATLPHGGDLLLGGEHDFFARGRACRKGAGERLRP